METALPPTTPTQLDFRAELHQLIDQIQDEAALLLTPQVTPLETEPELSPAWQRQLEAGMKELDEGKGIPFAEAMARLQGSAA